MSVQLSDSSRPTIALWRDYLELTKPRMLVLMVVSTLAAMMIAEDSRPSLLAVLSAVIGGMLAAGGGCAINSAYDADLDAQLSHLRKRPVASERVTRGQAIWFGSVLVVMGLVVLALLVNILSAGLALLGFVLYIPVYTIWLRRRSISQLQVGSLAGAIPPLVGYAAVTGTISFNALILGAILFYWAVPHFLALSIVYEREYAELQFPTAVVLYGEQYARGEIFWYSLALVVISTLPLVTGAATIVYGGCVLILGSILLWQTWHLKRISLAKRRAIVVASWALYRYLLLYMGGIFLGLILDRIMLL